jgi:phosphoserine phosphatase
LAERFSHVLNVIAEEAQILAAKLRGLGEPAWLAEGRAFDIPFTGNPQAVLVEGRHAAGNLAADMNVVAAMRRRKKLLIADMDSTIVGCECIDELAAMAGVKEKVAAITERAMQGELDFASSLRERVVLLKGLPLERLARVYAERVRLNPGARALVATMRAHGAKTVLVSGSFTYFTRRVAEDVGFDTHQANRLRDEGKKLTGEVEEPILGREAKLKALEDAVAANRLDFSDTLAAGDGANDIDMIKRAGLGVAYHAKPIVVDAADATIAHGDLTALLYLQGYRTEQIIRS